jgi:hypothetical protein
MQRIAIINSRQSLRPTGASAWVEATEHAITALTTQGDYVFLASLGEVTFELTLFHLSNAGAEVEIALTTNQLKEYARDEDSLKQYLVSEYRLSAERLRIIRIDSHAPTTMGSSHARDLELLSRADIITPISIRQGGFWSERLESSAALSAKVDSQFEVPYEKERTRIKQSFAGYNINPATARRLDGHLIHWSRTTNRPWPGETRYEYYRALNEAREIYPRSAYVTIQRILDERRVSSSARHLSERIAMVSLTSASLAESVGLMQYRARYREMTFEPYAIAIPVETARRLGARKVAYHTSGDFAKLSIEDKLFAHSRGADGSNWAKEKEWRIRGDADLASVWRELVVLTETREQASRIDEKFGVETLTVFD